MITVMLGPPGTGKGTISQYLKEKHNFNHISSGDLIRAEIKSGSDLGNEIKQIVSEGKLVNDDIVLKLVQNAVSGVDNSNIVLDGFPRTSEQAGMLDNVLLEINKKLDLVIDLESENNVIIKRLTMRRTCPECNKIYGIDVPPKEDNKCDLCGVDLIQRADDKEEVVRDRLNTYRELTAPLIKYYEGKGILKVVDGNRPLEQIYKDVSEIIENSCI